MSDGDGGGGTCDGIDCGCATGAAAGSTIFFFRRVRFGLAGSGGCGCGDSCGTGCVANLYGLTIEDDCDDVNCDDDDDGGGGSAFFPYILCAATLGSFVG